MLPQTILLGRRRADIGLIRIVQGQHIATPRRLAELVDSQVMQDREQPASRIAIRAALAPMADGAQQGILHKIIGRRRILEKATGIAPQCGNERLYQLGHVCRHIALPSDASSASSIIASALSSPSTS
jgi:hypothetical protein